MSEPMYLYDEVEDTQTRYVSFVDDTARFDLALITTERFFGKTLVLNLQSNRYAIIGQDDLEEPGYLEQGVRHRPGRSGAAEKSSFSAWFDGE